MNIIPILDEVKNLYMEYKAVPLSAELPMTITASEVIKKLKKVSAHCYMLESAEDIAGTGRYTFLGFDPKTEITCRDGEVTITDEYGVKRIKGTPRQYINEILEKYRSPRLDYLPTFTGGLVGYFGYDYVKYAEPSLRLHTDDDGSFKDVDLMLFDMVIAFDNLKNKIKFI